MQLQIKYKDRTDRIVNLTPEFFSTGKMPDRQSDPGVAQKSMDFAYSCGNNPYYIGVFRGNITVYETYIRKNNPDEQPQDKYVKVDEKDIKKKLRRQFKRKLFKDKVILQF